MAKRLMTREEKLRYEAKQRRLGRESQKSALNKFYPSQLDQMVEEIERLETEDNTANNMVAFRPEYMFDTDQELEAAWEESGVMDNYRNTNG